MRMWAIAVTAGLCRAALVALLILRAPVEDP